MARDAWLDHLAQVPLFAECDKRQLQQVAAAAVEISIDPGKVLVREGEPGHECFVIVSGTATVSRDGSTIANLGPGAVVGELAPLTGGVRTATVTADSAMEVLVIAQRELMASSRRSPVSPCSCCAIWPCACPTRPERHRHHRHRSVRIRAHGRE